MRPLWRVMLLLVPILVWSAAVSGFSFAEDNNRSGSNADPNREIEEIKREIRRLQQRVDELEAQGSRLQRTNSEIKARDEKLQAGTTQQFQSLQAQMASPNIFAEAINRYLGTYRFTLVGGVAAASFTIGRATSTLSPSTWNRSSFGG